MFQRFIRYFTHIYRYFYSYNKLSFYPESSTHSKQEELFNQLQNETEILRKQYSCFMKNTFTHYDIVRFVSLDLIYHVFKDIRNTLSSNEFDTVILMGLQSFLSKQTLGSSFLYQDETYITELQKVLYECNHLWENEKQALNTMDFDSQFPWENTFQRNNNKKILNDYLEDNNTAIVELA